MPAEFQAVVLAAGRGSRLTDLTARTPKALLPIANKPMIWYPIKTLENAGFEEAIVIVQEGHQAAIRSALIEQCEVKIKLDFVTIPGGEDWGTADSLRHIKDKIKTDMLVVSCDIITDMAIHLLADVHRTYDATVTMMMAPTPDVTEMSAPGGKSSKKIERDIVGFDESGNRVLFVSSEADFDEHISFRKSFFKKHPKLSVRSNLTDCHLYILKKWILDYLTQERSMNTIKGELLPFLVRKQFGQPKKQEKDLSTATIHQKSQTGPDSMVGDGSKISEKVGIKRSVIGNHCTLGEKVKVTNSIIMDHVTIEEGASLTGCVICNSAHIGEKSELKDCLVGASHNVMAMGKFTNEVIVDVDQMMEI